jgi:hypothetical protein
MSNEEVARSCRLNCGAPGEGALRERCLTFLILLETGGFQK